MFVCSSIPPLTALLSLWLKYPRHLDLSTKSLSKKILSMVLSLLTHAIVLILSVRLFGVVLRLWLLDDFAEGTGS